MDITKIKQTYTGASQNLEEVSKIYGKPFFSNWRKKALENWEQEVKSAKIVFMSFVQASGNLYKKDPENSLGGAMCLYSLDETKVNDAKWLSEMAKEVANIRSMETPTAELKTIKDYLNDTSNMYADALKIPSSVSGNDKTYIKARTIYRDEDQIKGGYIQDDSVLVCLHIKDKNGYDEFSVIPAKKY
ncbi:MAG: hypothetical protein ACK5N8_01770 [Alphaproteobacteria bacterium]